MSEYIFVPNGGYCLSRCYERNYTPNHQQVIYYPTTFLCISYKVGDDAKGIVKKKHCKQEQNLLNRLATNCPITVQFCIILHLCILWTPFSVVGLEGDHIQFQNMIGL